MYMKRLGVATILSIVIFGAVYGLAASMSIGGLMKLGISPPAAIPSPPDVTSVQWVLYSDNPAIIHNVYITFAHSVCAPGQICMRLYVAGSWTSWYVNPLSAGQTTLDTTFEDVNVLVAGVTEIQVLVSCS